MKKEKKIVVACDSFWIVENGWHDGGYSIPFDVKHFDSVEEAKVYVQELWNKTDEDKAPVDFDHYEFLEIEVGYVDLLKKAVPLVAKECGEDEEWAHHYIEKTMGNTDFYLEKEQLRIVCKEQFDTLI